MKGLNLQNVLISIAVVSLFVILEVLIIGYYKKTQETPKNPLVIMSVAGYGEVKMELYPDKAPNTVANFIELINGGYYNGITFHRVIGNLLIQGGDKEGTGAGETGFTIPGEFFANGYKGNDVRHEKGTLSMARADYSSLSPTLKGEGYNSGSTQFFVMVDTVKNFDGLYAAFGKVISGIEIIEEISNLPTTTDEEGNKTETPSKTPVIETMSVNTYGVDYGEVKRGQPFDYYSWMLSQYSTNPSLPVLRPDEMEDYLAEIEDGE